MAYPYRNSQWIVNEIGCAQAVSRDGVQWIRKPLHQVTLNGSKNNNRFFVVNPKARWTANKFMDVIHDPHDPDPARRYKGLLGAHNRAPVVSPDGIHWTALKVKPIPSADTSTLIYDELGKRYVAVVKTQTDYGRSAAVAFSEDFETWTRPRLTFRTDQEDQTIAMQRIRRRLADPGMQNPLFNDPEPDTAWTPEQSRPQDGPIDAEELNKAEAPTKPRRSKIPTWRAETYRLGLFPYEGVYMGVVQIFYPTGPALPARNNTLGFHEFQLMLSRDPQLRRENWVRLGGREPFLETSRLDKGLVGNFDRLQIGTCNRPLVMGDELWFYYTGSKSRTPPYKMWPDGRMRNQKDLTPEEKADFEDGWIAVCLATLRLDGFVSLDAGKRGGHVLTKPLKLAGSKLFLNLDAPEGHARVEILDEQGKPIAGFAGEDAAEVTGDGVRLPVQWRAGQDIGVLAGRIVQLKIHLQNAGLYALWTGQ
jgi:hypothetical protein